MHEDYKVMTVTLTNYHSSYESDDFSRRVSYELSCGWELYGDLQSKTTEDGVMLIQPLVRYS